MFAIDRDGDQVDLAVERQHGHDLIAVDDVPVPVDRQHAVAVTVEGDAEVKPLLGDGALERAQVGRTAADVDVRAVGLVADSCDLRAQLRERLRREAGVRAVCAIHADPQALEVGSESFDDVLQVAVRGDADFVDLAAAGCRLVEERLDLFLLRVGQLLAVAIEELHAVVLGGIV